QAARPVQLRRALHDRRILNKQPPRPHTAISGIGQQADAADGCVRSGRLFVEYAAVMKGAAQLYWSRGLKALV
ncbi:hypothetical protein, partial [Aeromonas caviae]|uniref:hypothetical protein n=1 Tax=Aeromonas caviae TaxID=648 RepID=UPI001CC5D427